MPSSPYGVGSPSLHVPYSLSLLHAQPCCTLHIPSLLSPTALESTCTIFMHDFLGNMQRLSGGKRSDAKCQPQSFSAISAPQVASIHDKSSYL